MCKTGKALFTVFVPKIKCFKRNDGMMIYSYFANQQPQLNNWQEKIILITRIIFTSIVKL